MALPHCVPLGHTLWMTPMEYRGLQLDRFQRQAIKAIDDEKSVLVSAPTGTGKTLIADYLVEQVIAQGGRIVYTAPIKALSNQKYREYCRSLGSDKVGIVTGDVVINRDAPLRIMTTEILRNILLQEAGPDGQATSLGELQAVIFDELHFIDDPERGTVWEEVLIYLPDTVRILGLSATLSNLRELAGWLSTVRSGPFGEVAVIEERRRAVPLRFMLANTKLGPVTRNQYDKEYKRWVRDMKRAGLFDDARRQGQRDRRKHRGRRGKRGQHNNNRDLNLPTTGFMDLVKMLDADQDLPALFFMFSRRGTETCARLLAERFRGYLRGAPRQQMERLLAEFAQDNGRLLHPELEQMYLRGIAFHHAGLNVRLKALVEELYEKRLVRLLFCTSTFALGINMPARTVLFEQLEKFNGEAVVPLTVRQFMQKAGRAGRRGMDDEGQVFIRMDFQDWHKWQEHLARLMSDQPEPVRSSFNLSFHSIVNLLGRYDEPEIRQLLSRSFLAYQRASRRDAIIEELTLQENRLSQLDDDTDDLQERSRQERRVRKLKRRLDREREWLWTHFQNKVAFLRSHGYIDAEGDFGIGARLVRKLQIEEIFMAELIMAGVFEDLSPEATFGLCAGLVQELPRKTSVRARLPRELEMRLGVLLSIYEGDIVVDATELAGGEPRCDPDMMALGTLWAKGETLPNLMRRIRSATDISGDLVGAFRRAKDLVGQLKEVFWEDEARRRALADVIRDVSRDEVEVVG